MTAITDGLPSLGLVLELATLVDAIETHAAHRMIEGSDFCVIEARRLEELPEQGEQGDWNPRCQSEEGSGEWSFVTGEGWVFRWDGDGPRSGVWPADGGAFRWDRDRSP